ncbi:hypothetical protein T8K17_10950 [Thalassobaculum sp. OXR-137]|uniref:hypothetical protein n=1 Tax=Thalassobaculum sp. OXR-137 TaxID=3100173 RepID=UPI002AC8D692|nr:hypothetical protein [Thalassobaculum sp. OXR-137]WPZ36653.1 hypothetical protein T8K17_10950 [Thalassobaculum sp. OXR-137]
MQYVVLGLCLIVGLALMGRWLLNAEPRKILKAAKWLGIVLAGALAMVLLFRGGLQGLAAAVPPLLLFLFRGRRIWQAMRNAAKTARGPTPGQSTGVRTRWLAMTLDHDTGAMDGEVLQGPFAGRYLSELSPQELSALADELDGDTESRQVFDAWLNRMGPEMWEQAGGEPPPGGGDESAMTAARAREILGVAEDANEADIREAHRRLMRANHPDRGGSSWLATQINLAKDVLLGQG